jgi:hypothetical protein
MKEVLELVKRMCDETVEATQRGIISPEEARFRLDLIESVVLLGD